MNANNIYLSTMEIGDRKIAIALISQNLILMAQYFVSTILNIEGTPAGNLVHIASKILVGLIFIYAFKIVLQRNCLPMLFTYIVAGIVICLNYLLYPNNWPFLKSLLFDILFICLPSFIYAYSVYNWNVMSVIMQKMSYIILGMGMVISCLVLFRELNIGIYSMVFSYYILLPCLVFLNNYFNSYSIIKLLLFLVTIAQIIIFGSRGAILSIILYVFIGMIINMKSMFKKLKLKTLVFNLSLLIFTTLFTMYYMKIISYVNEKLMSVGIYSRTLSLFLSDEIYMSNRDTHFYNHALDIINENIFIGTGIGSDRLYIGNYVHNIFLEFAMDFGIIISVFIIFYMILLFTRMVFLYEKENANFILIFFCLGVVPLMVSGSYLEWSWFWIYLGLAINAMRVRYSRKQMYQESGAKENMVAQPLYGG